MYDKVLLEKDGRTLLLILELPEEMSMTLMERSQLAFLEQEGE
jgi:hypothetical protein